jgi:hypothetical protein
MSISRKLVLGTTAALVAALTALAPASAGGRHHHHDRHHHHYRYWHKPVVVVPSYERCGYYYRKWKYTGSRYWRARYFACVS